MIDKLSQKHYGDVSWVFRHLILLVTQLFLQKLNQANKEVTIKALHYWPFVKGIYQSLVDSPHKGSVITDHLWGESTGDWWIPFTKGE